MLLGDEVYGALLEPTGGWGACHKLICRVYRQGSGVGVCESVWGQHR